MYDVIFGFGPDNITKVRDSGLSRERERARERVVLDSDRISDELRRRQSSRNVDQEICPREDEMCMVWCFVLK